MTNPRQVVTQPHARPPVVGLLPALRALDSNLVSTPSDVHWMNGFTWEPEACQFSGRGDPCVTGRPLPTPSPRSVLTSQPFYVYSSDKCSAFSFQERDYAARARRQFLASLSHQIAVELWTGHQAQASAWSNPYLTSAATTQLSVAAGLNPNDALACLEDYLASCSAGGVGVIHCTRRVAILWDSGGALFRDRTDPALVTTINGTPVIADSGYPGTAPSGISQVAATQWAYASSIPAIFLDEPQLIPDSVGGGIPSEAVNQRDNTIEYFMQGDAAYQLDGCCLAGVGVITPACLSTTLGS